jgi:hypothetical protein
MKKRTILFLITLLLVGCASAAQSPDTSKGPVDTHQTPGITPTADSPMLTPDKSAPVIVLEKSGGIAGINKKWTIYADGRVLADGQTGKTLSGNQVNNTLADIQKLGFFGMAADYSTLSTCNDCFMYRVTINSEGRSKTVSGVEGDANTPAEFSQIIEKINSLITP